MKMSLIRGSMMLGAYALLALGAVVLVTGAYVLAFSAMRRFTIGVLMISYGLVMLALGVGMVGRLIIVMIQGSASSGTVMILLGLAMLYSGFDMTRNYTDRLHPSHPL
jgi:dipeptide/tripeptide permease